MTLLDALDVFYGEQEYKGNSPATVKHYRDIFAHFLQDSGAATLEDFNERAISAWLIAHRQQSQNTLRTYDRALRVLSNWLQRRGYLSQHVMATLPRPRAKPKAITVFTVSDVRAMLDVAKASRNPLREQALIALLLDTGSRIGEAMTLTLQAIRWQDGSILLDGKTGERTVPMGRKCKQALKRYIDRERTASSTAVQDVFLNRFGRPLPSTAATQQLALIAKRAGVEASKLGPHTFRHTFAVSFIRAGGDAFTLQRILAHTTLEMTRRYVHLADSDLREAHRKFAPGDKML